MEMKMLEQKAVDVCKLLDGCNQNEVAAIIGAYLKAKGLQQVPIFLVWYDIAEQVGADYIKINRNENGDVLADIHIGIENVSPDSEKEDDDNVIMDEDDNLEEIEKDSIKRALERNDGSRTRAAQDLHISTRTLYRKMQHYGL